ncbi:MAG: FapA family protein [Butyrivibrio sp.]|nr:FapA family protein [Butyrivibrio sp.]
MSNEPEGKFIALYDEDDGDVNGYIDNIQNDKESIERELKLCIQLGADFDVLKSQKFNIYQLIEIRKGLEKGFDVSKYMDSSIPWTEMEEIRKEMKSNVDLSKYREQGFDTAQLAEIRRGMIKGVDVSNYDKKEYYAEQMREIRLGLMHKIPVIFYQDANFNSNQMEQIRLGLEEGLDISIYASSNLPYQKMKIIRESMPHGLFFDKKTITNYDASILEEIYLSYMDEIDLDSYVKKGFDGGQLKEIHACLKEGLLDINKYIDISMRGECIHEIRLGLESGIDVSLYAKIEYSYQQMSEIRQGLENQIDASRYADKLLQPAQMKELRLGLQSGVDISQYDSMVYGAKEMMLIRKWMEAGHEVPLDKRIIFDADKERFNNPASKSNAALWDYLDTAEGKILDISEDEMECYITLPKNDEFKDKYSVDFLMTVLFNAHVRNGIKKEVINEIIEHKRFDTRILVAQGFMPVNGKDGYYDYFIEKSSGIDPEFDFEGKANYSKIKFANPVKIGQKIAFYHRATRGNDGYTITGKKLLAKSGKEQPIIKGKGLMVLNDKITYVSTLNGLAKFDGTNIIITPYKVFKNLDSDYVEYDGTVIVAGNVNAGSVIKCTGDCLVKGRIISSQVTCGGNAIFVGGATGNIDQKCILNVGEIMGGNAFEWCTIKSSGSVFANEFLSCKINAAGKVITFGNKGTICSGVTQSLLGVETAILGSETVSETVVITGATENLQEEYRNYTKELSRMNEEMRELHKQKERFSIVKDSSNLQMLQLKIKVNAAISILEKEIVQTLQNQRDTEQKIKDRSDAKIIVRKIIYPGTTLEIDGRDTKIYEIMTNPRGFYIEKQKKRIVVNTF